MNPSTSASRARRCRSARTSGDPAARAAGRTPPTSRRVVDAHDAAASRQRDRLDDTGKRNASAASVPRIDRVDTGTNQWHGRPASRRRSRVAACCARPRPRRADDRAAERFADARGDHRRPIADREDAVDRTCPGQLEDRPRRAVFVVKRIGIARSCQGSSSRWQRSVAKTRSTPRRSAARRTRASDSRSSSRGQELCMNSSVSSSQLTARSQARPRLEDSDQLNGRPACDQLSA